MQKTTLGLIIFFVLIFIGILVYDNYQYVNWNTLQKEGLAPLNRTAPQILPSIPYQFMNIIFVIIVIVFVVGLLIGVGNYFMNR